MGGGGKGGGGGGAGAMLEYGNKALDLQRQIYDENKQYIQPYFQAGTTGLNELMFRLGLGTGQGGSPTMTREQLMAQYRPQYTTQGQSAAGSTYMTSDGRLVQLKPGTDKTEFMQQIFNPSGDGPGRYDMQKVGIASKYYNNPQMLYDKFGLRPYQENVATVDNAGLNAAVDAAYSNQQAQAEAARQNPLFGSLLQNYTGQDIYNDPSYNFRFNQGQKAAERALAAQGRFLAPAGAQALQAYGQEMASQEYGNAYNRFVNDQTNIYNRLASIAGMGQTATGQLTGVGQNFANAGTDLYTGMGNAITAANQAKAANRGSMFNTLLGAAGQIGSAYFSDPALKKDVKYLGVENGHKVYEFAYRNDDSGKRYIGVMADEIAETNPEAVTDLNGYLAVDYNKIGVKFREVTDAA